MSKPQLPLSRTQRNAALSECHSLMALALLSLPVHLVVILAFAARSGADPASQPADEKLNAHAAVGVTQHDIMPILLRRCTVCHGLRQQEAGLDLRSKAAMLKGGKSGPAIVPGNPDESLVIRKIRAGEMPPRRRVVEVSVKPIETAEAELLARWIELGAPEVPIEPDFADPEPDLLVTDKDREFWSFRPPQAVVVPVVRHAESVSDPIDAFILEKLQSKGLSLAPQADRLTLMRRAYLDLTGLPPEPAEVLAYRADDDPNAYEKMIDHLLASPRYGERWGRHWLDVAGYADSEGKTDQDLRRPFTWRYRDYVIQSFNADKPYDRLLIEQIAGDELADYEQADITAEIHDNLVATGFLRMAPDGTFANITNFVPDRLEVIADEIQVLGSAVMGLTLNCARCHNHKFDPIPQRDYYRLLDVFKGAFDEHDWLKPNVSEIASSGKWGYRLLPHVLPEERRQWEADDGKLKAEIASLKAALERQAAEFRMKYTEERLAKLPPELHDDLRRMLATPPEQRNDVQKYLAEKFEKLLTIDLAELKNIDADFKRTADENDKAVKALQAKRRPEPMVHALWDRGEPSPTYLLRRGDYLKPGPLVGPGVPSVLTDGRTRFEVQPPWPGAKSTGRRLAFARWLTRPDHPLTARVMVNRIWRHHFGTGLVKTLGNFGTTGAPPTHPELLDWLATEFVRQGWSVKTMHRLMMTSAAYRQSSLVTPTHELLDPDNALFSRMPLRRVDAEVLYDSILLAAGRLDETRYGPPDAVETNADGLVTPVATSAQHWRRSIYVEQRRKQIPTLLESFDLPQMNPNCIDRADSNVAPQALHLLNNATIHKLTEHFAARVQNEAGDDPAKQIERVYLTALSRLPSSDEAELALATLAELTDHWSKRLAGAADPAETSQNEASLRALSSFCHTILNSAEFLYVD
jgi:hypothetical protein